MLASRQKRICSGPPPGRRPKWTAHAGGSGQDTTAMDQLMVSIPEGLGAGGTPPIKALICYEYNSKYTA